MNRSARARSRSFQEGAATLVVVMMLFLIMALLAAYANRSVLFEQRMSISYSRASLSQEAAESGIEWTLAQLNGEAVDASCKPVDSGGRRFVDRYLAIDPANRVMSGTSPDTMGVVDCARDTSNNTWACRCPDAASPRVTAAPISNDPAVSFVTHLSGGTRGGTVMVNVMGCTDSVVDKCAADFNGVSKSLLGRSVVSTLVGFVSAVRNPPAAPLVVRGDIESSGAQGLGLHNADAKSGGLLAMVGGTWAPASTRRLDSIPGGALNNTVLVRDDLLHDYSADEFFKKFMGASLARYRQHPALRTITCNGDCSAAIRDAYQAGKRIMWVEGPLTMSSSGIFGQVDDPIVLIATGDAVLSGAFRFNGLLVSQGNVEWTGAGSPAILTGALLVGGSMRTNGGMDIVYQQAVSDQLRNRVGSFVRVPGSWIDLSRI